jgi:hypothetical protein
MRCSASWIGFGIALLGGAAIAAEPCPPCPPGCIPEAFVEQYKPSAVEVERNCPPGCIALEKAKVLRDRPGCELGVARDEGAVGQQAEPRRNVESTRTRTVLLPSALGAPAGEVIATGYAAGLWDLEYVLSDNLQVGAYVVLPVYVAGVFPSIKAQFALSDRFSVGFGALAGLVGPYAGDESGSFALVAAGHAEVTFHTRRHMLNLGLMAVGAGVRSGGGGLDMFDGAILLPNAGYRFAFHPDWSFQLELTGPLLVADNGLVNDEAIIILSYGFRGHGDIMFGDVGFTLPLFSAYIDDAWKYTPLGIPYFSIGFKF